VHWNDCAAWTTGASAKAWLGIKAKAKAKRIGKFLISSLIFMCCSIVRFGQFDEALSVQKS
jgi:hypothetical protein